MHVNKSDYKVTRLKISQKIKLHDGSWGLLHLTLHQLSVCTLVMERPFLSQCLPFQILSFYIMFKWKETLMFTDLWTSGWKCSEDEVSKSNLMKLKTRKVNTCFFFNSYLRLICAPFLRKSLYSILSGEGIYLLREQCMGPWIPWQQLISLCQAGSLHLLPSDS